MLPEILLSIVKDYLYCEKFDKVLKQLKESYDLYDIKQYDPSLPQDYSWEDKNIPCLPFLYVKEPAAPSTSLYHL